MLFSLQMHLFFPCIFPYSKPILKNNNNNSYHDLSDKQFLKAARLDWFVPSLERCLTQSCGALRSLPSPLCLHLQEIKHNQSHLEQTPTHTSGIKKHSRTRPHVENTPTFTLWDVHLVTIKTSEGFRPSWQSHGPRCTYAILHHSS